MPGTRCAEPAVQTYNTVDALPDDALHLLEGLFGDPVWWRVVLAHGIPAEAEPIFATVRTAGTVTAIVPLLRANGHLGGLTTPYTCTFTPGLGPVGRIASVRAIARFYRSAGVIRLDAIPAEWDALADLEAGARQGGLIPLRFDHFGNWYEDVAGLDWPGYLRRRPGALRETIRRRLRHAEKLPEARFDLFTRKADMDRAADAFEAVYARSWKEPEPCPTFNVALLRAMAGAGRLRLGVWSVGAVPVAVQLWVVYRDRAVVLKLAHDEAFKALSPGTVLTALMLRHLLERDHVKEIDFGRGDDPYKRGWAMQRRQRIGVLLVNPRSAAGLAELIRHAGGRLQSWLRPRLASVVARVRSKAGWLRVEPP